jgi:peroxiredoxin
MAWFAPLAAGLGLTACEAARKTDPAQGTRSDRRVAIGPESDRVDARTIVGRPAPAWDVDWMGVPPIQPTDLAGNVVLVRWFTEGCPYCTSTAPSLVALHRELEPSGLRVIGMYHHKSTEQLEVENVRALVEKLGFQFPVAIDHHWRTLRRWWLDDHAGWTSISFLIDRRGIVRYVHTGGEYPPGSAEAEQMRRWIDRLLAES